MLFKSVFFLTLFAVVVGGCARTAESEVLGDASDALNCPESQCKIIEEGVTGETDRVYRVFGCGHEAAFHCVEITTRNGEDWSCTRTA
jgi:hypothetical protein